MRPTVCTLIFLILLGPAGSVSRGDDEENRKRLEAMPREQRLHLSRTIERFDNLPATERAGVRDLDSALSGLDPEVQSRYRLLLRRYHVWVGGLDDDQKKQLAAVGSVDDKLALVTKWRKVERDADTKARKNLVMGIHPGDLGTIAPFEMANALAVWFQLDDKQRLEVEKFDTIPRRMIALNRMGRDRNPPPVMRSFPKATEDALIRELENDETVKAVFLKAMAKQEKTADLTTTKKKAELLRGNYPLHPMSESLYFMKHPAAPVSQEHLAQFEALIPGWLRATLDPLPPDDARRRLTILYRQIYPPGQEIPPTKEESARAKAVPKPAAPNPPPASPF